MNYIIFNQPTKLSELDNYAFYYNSLAFEAAPLLEGGSEYASKWKVSLPSYLKPRMMLVSGNRENTSMGMMVICSELF